VDACGDSGLPIAAIEPERFPSEALIDFCAAMLSNELIDGAESCDESFWYGLPNNFRTPFLESADYFEMAREKIRRVIKKKKKKNRKNEMATTEAFWVASGKKTYV
jgi:hypothetical protein